MYFFQENEMTSLKQQINDMITLDRDIRLIKKNQDSLVSHSKLNIDSLGLLICYIINPGNSYYSGMYYLPNGSS